MAGLEDLPAWAQVLSSIAMFVGTALGAAYVYFKRLPPLAALAPGPQLGSDLRVVGATFADRYAIERLEASISRLCDIIERQADDSRIAAEVERRVRNAIREKQAE